MKIIKKPWGQEELIEVNKDYMVKKLTMFKDHRCSLQFHKYKKETIYVLSGELEILIGKNKESLERKKYIAGESVTIDPNIIHRMRGITETTYLECSTPQLEDVERLEDDYNRNK